MNEPEPNVWPQIAPQLDVAMAGLGEKDRNAVVLRFFENKSLGEVGLALGASEAAAKMRVNRALEKLRKFFSKRGIILPAALIAGAVSANSVHAAPAGLAIAVTATAAKGSAAAASTLTLVKGALKLMAWTKMKSAAVAGAGLHFDPQDADKDDYTQNCVGGAADSSLTEFWQIHNKSQNIMFADGHSQWCKHYVAGDMTFAYAAMTNWIRY